MSRIAKLLFTGLLVGSTDAMAQPAPRILQINWETVKAGRDGSHEQNEKGWPVALAAAGSRNHYTALAATTGTPEMLYISAFDSYAQIDERRKAEAAIPMLSAQLAKLWERDAEYLSNARTLIAEQIDSLAVGSVPDWPSVRGYRISMVRVRIGHAPDFERLRRIQRATAERAGVDMHVGVYRVTNGVNVPTFMVFRPFTSLSELDSWPAMGNKVGAATTAEERAEMTKLSEAAITSNEQNIFTISPMQSYPSAEMAKASPEFWKGHPVLAARVAAKPTARKQP